MAWNLLIGLLYFGGLLLLLTPPRGEGDGRRIARHMLALLMFGVGAVEIQGRIEVGPGRTFLLVSAFLLVVVEGIRRVWVHPRAGGGEETSGAGEESDPGGFSSRND